MNVAREWWEGRVLLPSQHEAINATHYPGTRQLCEVCGEPTERCEDDDIWLEDGTGPLCPECYHKTPEGIAEDGRSTAPTSARP